METYDLSKVTAEDFQPHLGQTVQIEFIPGQPAPVVIENLISLNTYTPLERGAFSVVLQAGADLPYQPQGIYKLLHPSSGTLEVFLVPIGKNQYGFQYEALFS